MQNINNKIRFHLQLIQFVCEADLCILANQQDKASYQLIQANYQTSESHSSVFLELKPLLLVKFTSSILSGGITLEIAFSDSLSHLQRDMT